MTGSIKHIFGFEWLIGELTSLIDSSIVFFSPLVIALLYQFRCHIQTYYCRWDFSGPNISCTRCKEKFIYNINILISVDSCLFLKTRICMYISCWWPTNYWPLCVGTKWFEGTEFIVLKMSKFFYHTSLQIDFWIDGR